MTLTKFYLVPLYHYSHNISDRILVEKKTVLTTIKTYHTGKLVIFYTTAFKNKE